MQVLERGLIAEFTGFALIFRFSLVFSDPLNLSMMLSGTNFVRKVSKGSIQDVFLELVELLGDESLLGVEKR